MTLYLLLKYVHVLSAIVAVGANITYSIWLARAAQKPEHLIFTLRTVKILDDWVANPAYVLLLPTGVAMALVAKWPLTLPWLLASLILYGIMATLGFGLYSPVLRRQIAAAESNGPDSPEYLALSNRGRLVGISIGVVTLGIIFLMVTKPTFGL